MTEIRFLGTGAAFAKGRRSNVALLIKHNDFLMQAECGPNIIQQLHRAGVDPFDVQYLFVSHSHGDHTLGFPMLILHRLTANNILHIYADPDTIATLEMLWALTFTDFGSHYLKSEMHRIIERGLHPMPIIPDLVTLTTVGVPSPPGASTMAARWDFAGGPTITFVTDTTPNAATIELARESDFLIHESTYSATLQPDANPSRHFHSSAQEAGEVARQAGCERLALVHLGEIPGERPDVLAEEARAGTDLKVIIPEDGYCFKF